MPPDHPPPVPCPRSRTRWGRHAPPPGRGHRAPALRLPRGVSRRRAADPASKPREAPRARGRRGMESSPRKAHRSPGFRAQALVSRNSASPAYRRSFPRARDSIWRARSFEIPSSAPICRSVSSRPPPIPNRPTSTRRSRSSS